MRIKRLHPWDVTPTEAAKIQEDLKKRISLVDHFNNVSYVCGVDVKYEIGTCKAVAAAVVLSFPGLQVIEARIIEGNVSVPYIPGLFSFREIPLLIPALEQLKTQPHLIFVDGQGYAHPKRVGLATHLGILTEIPTIGCAKSRLIGTHSDLPQEKGALVYLYDKTEIIGAVVRTRANVAPVYVSAGHHISLATAIDYVLKCTTGFRLPEPLREAHRRGRTSNSG